MNHVHLLLLVGAACAAPFTTAAHHTEDSALGADEVEVVYAEGRRLLDNDEVAEGAARLREAGIALWRTSQYEKARGVFAELYALDGLPTAERVDAMRVVAQISLLNLNDRVTAQRMCTRILESSGGLDLASTGGGDSRVAFARGQALHFLAQIYQGNGRLDDAIAMRRRFLEQNLDFPDQGLVKNSFINNARDYLRQGRHEEAVREYDAYILRYPDADLRVRHSRAIAHGYARGTREHASLLAELWNAQEFREDIWRFNVGRELVGSLVAAGRYIEAMGYAQQLSDQLDGLSDEYRQRLPTSDQDMLMTAHSESLFYLAESQLALMLIDAAQHTYNTLISRFPDSPCALHAKEQLEAIEKALAENTIEALMHITVPTHKHQLSGKDRASPRSMKDGSPQVITDQTPEIPDSRNATASVVDGGGFPKFYLFVASGLSLAIAIGAIRTVRNQRSARKGGGHLE